MHKMEKLFFKIISKTIIFFIKIKKKKIFRIIKRIRT